MAATLHIEHPISSFEDWKAAFDRFAPLRASSGVRRVHIQRPLDDAHYVVVDLDFDTPEAAARFRDVLRTRIWSSADRSPALAGEPQTRILEPVESA